MNAKYFTGYKIHSNKDCGRKNIFSWNDGSSTNHGTVTGVSNCARICDMHAECAAFVHRTSDDMCGFWKRGPLNLHSNVKTRCHKKTKGSTLIYM